MNRVLFIDLENCPSQIQSLMEDLKKYSHIVVCYAQSGAKIPIDWIMPLNTVVNDQRLKLIKMPAVGKNAADFGIAFWAGILMAQLPEDSHFDIISNDTDLDYVVKLLEMQDRSAERVGNKKESISVVKETKTTSLETPDYFSEYCLHLLKHNKPAKKETLLNSIKAKFKLSSIDATKVFEMLIKNNIVSLVENKVTYNQQNLNTFAKK